MEQFLFDQYDNNEGLLKLNELLWSGRLQMSLIILLKSLTCR